MAAEDLAQGRVEEVGAGVVAGGGGADLAVDDGVDGVADGEAFAGNDAVGPDALHGLGGAGDIGDYGVVVGGVESADVADLAAGVGVEAGGVEDDLARFAGGELVDAEAVFDEGEDAGRRPGGGRSSPRRRFWGGRGRRGLRIFGSRPSRRLGRGLALLLSRARSRACRRRYRRRGRRRP